MTDKQPVIPDHYFSAVSSECQELYKYGHYYGCIALCQSVAEAIARFMVERNGKQTRESIYQNLAIARTGIVPDVRELLRAMYGEDGKQRNDFHHLNPSIETDNERLKEIASQKIDLLNKVETTVFAIEFPNGGLKAKYELYWDKVDGAYQAFLRFDSDD